MRKFFQSTNQDKSNKKKRRQRRKKSMFLNVAVLGVVGIIGVFYLIETNSLAVKGYKVSDLQKTVISLNNENQNLEIKTVELRSMVNLEKKVTELQMVKVDNVVHINQINSAVAVR